MAPTLDVTATDPCEGYFTSSKPESDSYCALILMVHGLAQAS